MPKLAKTPFRERTRGILRLLGTLEIICTILAPPASELYRNREAGEVGVRGQRSEDIIEQARRRRARVCTSPSYNTKAGGLTVRSALCLKNGPKFAGSSGQFPVRNFPASNLKFVPAVQHQYFPSKSLIKVCKTSIDKACNAKASVNEVWRGWRID